MELLVYTINYKMEFNRKPTKYEVQCRLWDLLAKGFTLRTPEEDAEYKKFIEEKNVYT